jgi:hypothetical protein
MSTIDWDAFEPELLVEELHRQIDSPDAEKMVWAFEQAVRIARVDEGLLDHVLAAVVCLVARVNDCSPRTVLELFFRRAVPDQEWRDRYLPLFD